MLDGDLAQLFPERGKMLAQSLCWDAGGGRFGLQKPLQANAVGPDPTRTNLFNLSRETDRFSSSPSMLAVSIDLEAGDIANRIGQLIVFARLIWHTGDGTNEAEIDVPARGTVAVVAAGDGLQVDVFRNTGPLANQDIVIARGNVGFASYPGGNATRTIETVPLPMPAPVPIPRFARRVTTFPDVFGAIAPPAGTLRFFRDPTVAPFVTVAPPRTGPGLGGGTVIPNSALFFDVTGVAGTIVQAVFELAL